MLNADQCSFLYFICIYVDVVQYESFIYQDESTEIDAEDLLQQVLVIAKLLQVILLLVMHISNQVPVADFFIVNLLFLHPFDYVKNLFKLFCIIIMYVCVLQINNALSGSKLATNALIFFVEQLNINNFE